MIVKKSTHKINAIAPKLPEGNFLAHRIGFWGLVKEVNSLNNTVTVVSDTGFEFPNIAVKSDEWVTVDDNKDYIPSQRNLPPKNSRVFVLTPTYSAVGAFILCSGFSRGDENIRTLWAQSKGEVEDKNNCRETKTQGGWDITEEYENGNFKAESQDGNITIVVNPVENSDKSQDQEISVTAWENKFVITKDGIDYTDKNGNEIKSTSDGISIVDKFGNKIETKQSTIEIMANNTNKIKIGNTIDTLRGLLNDVISHLNGSPTPVNTAGSPANHTIIPGQFTSEITKLNQILS